MSSTIINKTRIQSSIKLKTINKLIGNINTSSISRTSIIHSNIKPDQITNNNMSSINNLSHIQNHSTRSNILTGTISHSIILMRNNTSNITEITFLNNTNLQHNTSRFININLIDNPRHNTISISSIRIQISNKLKCRIKLISNINSSSI